jgi:hypothetical protein
MNFKLRPRRVAVAGGRDAPAVRSWKVLLDAFKK